MDSLSFKEFLIEERIPYNGFTIRKDSKSSRARGEDVYNVYRGTVVNDSTLQFKGIIGLDRAKQRVDIHVAEKKSKK